MVDDREDSSGAHFNGRCWTCLWTPHCKCGGAKAGVGSLPCLEARPLDGGPMAAEHGVCVLGPPMGLQSSLCAATRAPEAAVGIVKVSVKTTKTCLRTVERSNLM